MYEGNPVDLQMEKVISADAIFDDTTRVCKVVMLLRCCEREIPVGRQESTEV